MEKQYVLHITYCFFTATTITRTYISVTLQLLLILVSITYYVLEVAIFTQQAERMRRIMMSSVPCLVLPHFSTLSRKQ